MSQFSHVDAAADIAALEAYLDRTARGLGAMKHCIVGAHVAAGSRVVLDIGCGVGHDLTLLAGAGITAIGVEPSAAFAGIARERTTRSIPAVVVVRAVGERLPMRDGAADGCRIERVLQHAIDPALVLREACRCVRRDGLIAVFEPDWSTMRVASDHFDDDASWLANVLHPGVGAELVDLVESTGARVVDVIEQHSIWPTLARAQIGIDFEAAVDRRIRQGAINNAEGTAWLEEQRFRDQNGTFRATITKRLVVAHAP